MLKLDQVPREFMRIRILTETRTAKSKAIYSFEDLKQIVKVKNSSCNDISFVIHCLS